MEAEPSPEPAGDLEVDLTAFLAEGTTLAPAGSEPDAVDTLPAPAAKPAVDLEVLTCIEADLAAVDDALLALDGGDPGRSPLLTELLAAPTTPTT